MNNIVFKHYYSLNYIIDSNCRFQICRNLLLICNILMNDVRMEETVKEAIRSVCTPEIVVLTQANFAMLWLSRLPALANIIQ